MFALGLETATVPSEISVALAGLRQAAGARQKKKPRYRSRTEGGERNSGVSSCALSKAKA